MWPSPLHSLNKTKKYKIAPFRQCNTGTKSLLAEPLLLHVYLSSERSRPLVSFIRSADKHRWTAAFFSGVQTSLSYCFTRRHFKAGGCAGLKGGTFVQLGFKDPFSFRKEICDLWRAVSSGLWE